MPYIRQDALSEAVLFKLFQLAQTSEGLFTRQRLVEEFSIQVGEKRIGLALEELAEKGLATYSPPRGAISRKGYQHIETSLLDRDSVAYSLERFGDEWLEKQTLGSDLIPASDRIVSLNHNQIAEIESSADELIAAIEPENSIDGDAEERSRVIAQVRAAKELVRAGSVRVYLMYETLFHALGKLIEKYAGKALGQVASKLLDLLVENILDGKK